jgi:hypothetical protein
MLQIGRIFFIKGVLVQLRQDVVPIRTHPSASHIHDPLLLPHPLRSLPSINSQQPAPLGTAPRRANWHSLRALRARHLNTMYVKLDDYILQEVTRIIVGIQCFAVGIELPKLYFQRYWKSVAVMLGPVMAFSWAVTALCSYLVFQTSLPTALIIGACLSPTDSGACCKCS